MEDLAVVECPACGEPQEHEVLKASPNNVTLRCLECGLAHTETPAAARPVEVQLVISDEDGGAVPDSMLAVADDEVQVGDEFEHQERRLLVTGLEARDGTYPRKAAIQELRVLHAKRFDIITLKLSLNQGERTRSFEQPVEPDDKVEIGRVRVVDGVPMVVKTLKSDQNRTLHKGFLLARNVRRAFCDAAPPNAQDGTMLATRLRGAPAKPVAPGSRGRAPPRAARSPPRRPGTGHRPGSRR